jgi:hypothetical protein
MTKTSKAPKLSATQTAYLRHLAGQGERPAGVAIGNITNALGRRNLIVSLPNRNGSYSNYPTAAAIPFLDI